MTTNFHRRRVAGVDLPFSRSERGVTLIGRSPPVTSVSRWLGADCGEAFPQDRLRNGRSPTPGTLFVFIVASLQ
jgi:hypothetical protein